MNRRLTIERFPFTQRYRLRHRHVAYVMRYCSYNSPVIYHTECSKCCASCTSIAGCCSHISHPAAPNYSQQIFRSGGCAHCSGTNPSLHNSHPYSSCRKKSISISIPLWDLQVHPHTMICCCSCVLVVGSVDERHLHFMRPSPGTDYAGGRPGCQSIFYCR